MSQHRRLYLLDTQRHHWSSTAVGYGPRSESGRHRADRSGCEDRSGHSRFGSAIVATVIGHCELSLVFSAASIGFEYCRCQRGAYLSPHGILP